MAQTDHPTPNTKQPDLTQNRQQHYSLPIKQRSWITFTLISALVRFYIGNSFKNAKEVRVVFLITNNLIPAYFLAHFSVLKIKLFLDVTGRNDWSSALVYTMVGLIILLLSFCIQLLGCLVKHWNI